MCLSAAGLVENGNRKWGLTLMSDDVRIMKKEKFKL